MGCHLNQVISHNRNGFVPREQNFMLLSGLIQPFGFITSLCNGLYNG